MRARRIAQAAVVSLLLVTASGCSGSDDTEAPAATAGSGGTAGRGGAAGAAGGSGRGGAAGAAGASGKAGHAGAAAGSGGAGAGGMAGAGGGGAAGSAGAALDMFTAWEQARVALRTSPDHLPARADELVAGKDPQKIFQFVRDQILTYPPSATGFDGAVTAQRWGARATLRGGAGTPREKAELLASLYARAGLTATLVQGPADPAKIDAHAAMLRTLDRPFAPQIADAQAAAWKVALGNVTPSSHPLIDADGKKTAALAASLLSMAPAGLTAPFDFTLGDVPLVAVTVAGKVTYANPIAPALAFGDAGTLGPPVAAIGADAAQTIHVKLEAAHASTPLDRFTVVEGDFAAEDVIGRRIQLAFAPPSEIHALAGMRVLDIETVLPVLSVIGADLTAAERDKLATVGDLLSLDGDTFQLAPDGSLAIDGVPLPTPVTDPAVIAQVATVGAEVKGATFTRIEVDVTARDAAGKTVPHLAASAFEVREDGKPVSFSLRRNEAPPPRVVLLLDLSTSIPPAFLGDGAVGFGDAIVDALYAKYPDAQVRVATIFFGANFVTDGWATTADDAKAQVALLKTAPGTSEVWQAIAEAENVGATAIVMATDGDASDAESPGFDNLLANGVPVLSLAIGTVNQAVLDEISTKSHGKTVPIASPGDGVTEAIAEIDLRAAQDYVLSYRAPEKGATTRQVTVTVNAKVGSGSYDVPATPAVPDGLAGAYLTVSVGGHQETLPLAGFGTTSAGTETAPVTADMLADVRSLLTGRVSFSVEGAAPPVSVVLDEWLGEKLSLKPLWTAAAAKDLPGVYTALGQGLSLTPRGLPFARAPLPGAYSTSALTFETGPRVTAWVQKLRAGGPVTSELDIFPLSTWATAADDPHEAWTRTLTATAALAVVEADLLTGTSTLESLAGAALTLVPAGQASAQSGLTAQESARWAALEAPFDGDYQLLVPLAPGAFWALHVPTGTVIGILPDGTGGGEESVCDAFDDASNYVAALGVVGDLMGASIGGGKLVATWEAKNPTIATIVSTSQGTGGADITGPVADFACGEFGDPVAETTPGQGYGAIAATLDAIGLDTGVPSTSLCGASGSSICP